MKQKATIEFLSHCQKCRIKAMKIASSAAVVSVTMDGDNKLVVVGDDVDVASLTRKLHKKVCTARILTVEKVKSKAEQEEDEKKKKEKEQKEKEEKEKKFKDEVLKRHDDCRGWIMALNGNKKDECPPSRPPSCPDHHVIPSWSDCPPPYRPTPQVMYCHLADDNPYGNSCSVM